MTRIPSEDLENDVARVVEELGRAPKKTEYNNHGQYSATTIATRFGDGSWITALETLGYDPDTRQVNRYEFTDEELRQDVEQASDAVDGRLTRDEYREHGNHEPRTVSNRFGDGSWVQALQELGIQTKTILTDDELRADVERVVAEIGEVPTISQYESHGSYSPNLVRKRFSETGNSWRAALSTLGYETQGRKGSLSREVLLNDLRRVADGLGHMPSIEEYRREGKYRPQKIASKLGGGQWPDSVPSLEDVFETAPKALAENGVSEAELRSDVQRVAESLGRVPSRTEYIRQGEYESRLVVNKLGNGDWDQAVETVLGGGTTTEEDLVQDFSRVVDELGHVPSEDEYTDAGAYSAAEVIGQFGDGDWETAVRVLGYELNEE